MMPDKKPDSAKSEGDSAKPGPGKEPNANGRQGGGLLAWLPLILTVVLMPVLAFTTTKFLIIPKVAAAREAATGEAETADPTPEASREAVKETKETKDNHDSGGKGRVKKKQSVPIAKVVVNVAGSMGTRYLLTSFTLVGTQNEFKSIIEENKD